MVEYLLKEDGKKIMDRHGDLGLVHIKKLPEGLKETKTNVIMTGSGGHDHSVINARLYLRKQGNFIIGYMEALLDCKLFHVEHGEQVEGQDLREAELEAGFRELRKQCEDTNEGLRPVID